MFCPNCGNEVSDEATICLGCGIAVLPLLSDKSTVPAAKVRFAGFILSFIAIVLTVPYLITLLTRLIYSYEYVIVALVVIVGLLVAGMGESIVGLVKARRDGGTKGFAIAGLIISILTILIIIATFIVLYFVFQALTDVGKGY